MSNIPDRIQVEIDHKVDWMFSVIGFNNIIIGNTYDVIHYFDKNYHETDHVVFMIPIIRQIFETEEVELNIYHDHGYSYPIIYIRQIVYDNDIIRKLDMLDSVLYNTYNTDLHITTDFGIPKEK